MAQRKRVRRIAVVAFALAVVGVPVTHYFIGGGRSAGVERSPDGRSRLEFRLASRWQQWTHPGADQLGYVSLYQEGGDVVNSPLFDLSGAGPVVWATSGVQVGTVAVYEPAHRRWSVDWSPHW